MSRDEPLSVLFVLDTAHRYFDINSHVGGEDVIETLETRGTHLLSD